MLSVKQIKKTAGRYVLSEFGIHFFAVSFIAVCVFAFLAAGDSVAVLAGALAGDTVYFVVSYLFTAFTIIMTVPLIYGYAVFQTNCVKNQKACFFDIFHGFSSIRLFIRSFKVFLALALRFIPTFAIPICLITEYTLYSNGDGLLKSIMLYGYDITYTFLVIGIIASLIISSMIYTRFIMSLYIVATRENYSVSSCFFTGRIYLKGCNGIRFKLIMSVIPIIFLTIITLCTALFYTLPLIITIFFVFAHERYQSAELNEKTVEMIFN